jgi:transposase
MGYRPIDPVLKRRAVCLVLDENRSVPAVCGLLGLGPTALRRWVDQERQLRATPPPTPEQIAKYEAELAGLREQVATLEAEKAVLKKQLPFHMERLLGKRRRSSKR